MSGGFGQDDGFFQGSYDNQQQGYGMPFNQQQDFGSFDYSSQGGYDIQPQYGQSQQFASPQPMYHGNILTPDQSAYVQKSPVDDEDYENEPPLLEELGM